MSKIGVSKLIRSIMVCSGIVLILANPGFTQTRINLRYQSHQADFSDQQGTRPFTTGQVLPPTCSVGQVFFKTDAEPGANLHLCTAADTWTAQRISQQQSVGTMLASIAVVGQDLVIGPCAGAFCTYSIGEVVLRQDSGASIRLNSGSGTVLGYLQQNAGLVVAAPSGLNLSCTGCTVVSNTTEFPWDSIPQFRWTAANGEWEASGTDLRSLFHKDAFLPGNGISVVRSGGITTISATGGNAGTGVTVVPDASAVGNEIVIFDDAEGQRLKRATGTGIVRIDSGVVSTAAVQVSDIAIEGKQGDGTKVVTSGAVTAGKCAEWDASGKLVSAGAPCVTTAGDVSGPASAATGEVALFSSATGKALGRASGTGMARLTNGVLSADTVKLSDIADKQGDGTKLVTSSAVTAGKCAEWDANGKLVSAAAACGSGGTSAPARPLYGSNWLAGTPPPGNGAWPAGTADAQRGALLPGIGSGPWTSTTIRIGLSTLSPNAGAVCRFGLAGVTISSDRQSFTTQIIYGQGTLEVASGTASTGLKTISWPEVPIPAGTALAVLWSCSDTSARFIGVSGQSWNTSVNMPKIFQGPSYSGGAFAAGQTYTNGNYDAVFATVE